MKCVCVCVCARTRDFHVCVIHSSVSALPPAAPLAPPPQGHGLSPSGALGLITHKANRIREWGERQGVWEGEEERRGRNRGRERERGRKR